MSEVCDYSIIINQRQDLRDIKADIIHTKQFPFDTSGRERREALLFITIQGPDRDVGIKINGFRVGILAKNLNATGSCTQIFRHRIFLKDGKNDFKFHTIGFIVGNAIGFFKQKA